MTLALATDLLGEPLWVYRRQPDGSRFVVCHGIVRGCVVDDGSLTLRVILEMASGARPDGYGDHGQVGDLLIVDADGWLHEFSLRPPP